MLRVGGCEVFVAEYGHGDPVLFLHGVPDSGAIWRDVVSEMAPTYRCIVPDWPGFGQSGSGAGLDCSLAGHANFVAELADAMDLRAPFHLVGHDFGALSAMAFVARHPDRVSRLVVSNTAFSPEYRWHLWARIWRMPVLGEASMALMNRWVFALSLRQGSRKLSDERIRDAYRLVTPETKRMILRLYRAMPESDWADWLPQLRRATARVPTLVLWGQQDPYLPAWMPERFGASDIRRYPDCGHWTPAEEPEAFARDLMHFLRA